MSDANEELRPKRPCSLLSMSLRARRPGGGGRVRRGGAEEAKATSTTANYAVASMAKVAGDQGGGACVRGSASCTDKDLEDADAASLLQRPARTKYNTATTYIFIDAIPPPIIASPDRSGQHGGDSDRGGQRSDGS